MRGAQDEYEDGDLDAAAAVPRRPPPQIEADIEDGESSDEEGENEGEAVEEGEQNEEEGVQEVEDEEDELVVRHLHHALGIRARRKKQRIAAVDFLLDQAEVSGDDSGDEVENEEAGDENLDGFIVADNEVEEDHNDIPPPNPYLSDSSDEDESSDGLGLGEDEDY